MIANRTKADAIVVVVTILVAAGAAGLLIQATPRTIILGLDLVCLAAGLLVWLVAGPEREAERRLRLAVAVTSVALLACGVYGVVEFRAVVAEASVGEWNLRNSYASAFGGVVAGMFGIGWLLRKRNARKSD
ncbi:MAG: hypothetical protein LBR58_06820 [Propionibacteriaceae bacterium]|jgi:uncharacterized membrane protein YfcA|nr:hypothetical protein [Propionibacteriaceae bacterium]